MRLALAVPEPSPGEGFSHPRKPGGGWDPDRARTMQAALQGRASLGRARCELGGAGGTSARQVREQQKKKVRLMVMLGLKAHPDNKAPVSSRT